MTIRFHSLAPNPCAVADMGGGALPSGLPSRDGSGETASASKNATCSGRAHWPAPFAGPAQVVVVPARKPGTREGALRRRDALVAGAMRQERPVRFTMARPRPTHSCRRTAWTDRFPEAPLNPAGRPPIIASRAAGPRASAGRASWGGVRRSGQASEGGGGVVRFPVARCGPESQRATRAGREPTLPTYPAAAAAFLPEGAEQYCR